MATNCTSGSATMHSRSCQPRGPMPIAPSTMRWLGATTPSRPSARAGRIHGSASRARHGERLLQERAARHRPHGDFAGDHDSRSSITHAAAWRTGIVAIRSLARPQQRHYSLIGRPLLGNHAQTFFIWDSLEVSPARQNDKGRLLHSRCGMSPLVLILLDDNRSVLLIDAVGDLFPDLRPARVGLSCMQA